MADGRAPTGIGGENLLFLTDEQLRQGSEAMFFAYRGFTADTDRILMDLAYGRAHHRAIHFIKRRPGIISRHCPGRAEQTEEDNRTGKRQ